MPPTRFHEGEPQRTKVETMQDEQAVARAAMDTCTLPGDIPSLLRWCSPIRSAADPARIGVVVGTYPSGDLVVCWTWEGLTEDANRADVVLDLTDATGRAHAAWWLAAWWETNRGNGAPSEVPLRGCVWHRCGLTSWRLMWSGCAVTFDPDGCGDAATYVAVPSLEDQPGDLEALRRVVLHVAGRVS